MLKNIIARYNGSLPDLKYIDFDVMDNLETILVHMDIEWIAEIFPVLVDAIHKGYTFNEILIYQIDRNIIGKGDLFTYDQASHSFIKSYQLDPIPNSVEYPQYYGGMDMYMGKEEGSIWWPFAGNQNLIQVNELRSILCLDSLEDYMLRKPFVRSIDVEEFLELWQR
jgi:hypothetical protein